MSSEYLRNRHMHVKRQIIILMGNIYDRLGGEMFISLDGCFDIVFH